MSEVSSNHVSANAGQETMAGKVGYTIMPDEYRVLLIFTRGFVPYKAAACGLQRSCVGLHMQHA